jgi:hypothetical protein
VKLTGHAGRRPWWLSLGQEAKGADLARRDWRPRERKRAGHIIVFMPVEGDSGPASGLSIELTDWTKAPEPAVWRAGWSLVNQTGAPVELLESWLPHDQFHRKREAFEPVLVVAPGGRVVLTAEVNCLAAPGEIVENAFLILRARWTGRVWRIFVRLRVECNEDGQPTPYIEALTAQHVGVSQRP